MNIARRLERRLEQFVDGMAARVFRGALHPVELANRLVREADLNEYQALAGPAIPNVYRLSVATDDAVEPEDVAALERELADSLAATAADRGWRVEGPVTVVVEASTGAAGMSVDTSIDAGAPPTWAMLVPVGGTEMPTAALRFNRTMVGRSADTDLQLEHAQVSRYHALVWREAGTVWVVDLQSSNGTIVAGIPVGAEPVELQDGEVVIFGPLSYRLELES